VPVSATLAPVHNAVRGKSPAIPVNLRALMIAWDALYFTPGEFHPDANKSSEWDRGAYLVQGPGHCGACHTPKSMLGGDKSSELLQGYALQAGLRPTSPVGRVRCAIGRVTTSQPI
jgi:mono/diheme cytochrome c family protein